MSGNGWLLYITKPGGQALRHTEATSGLRRLEEMGVKGILATLCNFDGGVGVLSLSRKNECKQASDLPREKRRIGIQYRNQICPD